VGELGTRVWNGGLVLGRYVERLGADFFQGKSCLELGSGTGLTGIIAAKVGSRDGSGAPRGS
jgi:predicted nicotinamide N-methyase